MLLQIGLRHLQARISHDLQRRRVALAQAPSASPGSCRAVRLGPSVLPPQSGALRNLGRALVAQVPDKAVQSGVGREVLVAAAAAEESSSSSSLPGSSFFGNLRMTLPEESRISSVIFGGSFLSLSPSGLAAASSFLVQHWPAASRLRRAPPHRLSSDLASSARSSASNK